MSEENVAIPAAPGTPESAPSAEEVWERTAAAPITKEDVRGEDPKPEAPSLPDRALVTGQLSELYASETKAADPIMDRLAQLEESLVPKVEPEHPEVYKEIQSLRAELARRDEEAAEAAAAEEREARKRTIREGFVEALRESEDFPAIVAAGYEEKLFEQLDAAQQAGEDISEETLLSDTEASLWSLYETLHALKNPTTSEEAAPSETPEHSTPKTLTPTLTAQDSAQDVESLLQGGVDRKAAAAELWSRVVG
jgi:hypothetical protein